MEEVTEVKVSNRRMRSGCNIFILKKNLQKKKNNNKKINHHTHTHTLHKLLNFRRRPDERKTRETQFVVIYLDGYSEESLEDVIVASLSREKEVVA